MGYRTLIYAEYATSTVAFLSNVALFLVARKYSSKLGAFKYILMAFAILECLYSIFVMLTLPMFFIYNHRVVVFTYDGLLSHTWFSTYAVGLYCTFSEMWIGLVAIMFIYRYISVCKVDLMNRIRMEGSCQLVIFIIYMCHVFYSLVCGTYFCTANRVPEDVKQKIREIFDIESTDTMGYWVATTQSEQGEFSVTGLMSVANHFALAIFSTFILSFCGYGIWSKLNEMGQKTTEYKRNKQVFITLLLQALIPLLMHQIPTALILSYSLLFDGSFSAKLIPAMSLLATIPKILDPLSILLIIKDYRKAVRSFLTEGRVAPSEISTATRMASTVPSTTHMSEA